MAFGEPRDPDGITAGFTNEPDELIRIFEAAFGLLELRAVRRIAAQRQNVLDSQFPRLLQHAARFGCGGVHARQVCHRRQALVALNPIDDHQRLLAGTPAGAVRHRAEIGIELAESGNRLLEQRALSLLGLRGEELEGNDGAPGCARGREHVAYELSGRVAFRHHCFTRFGTVASRRRTLDAS